MNGSYTDWAIDYLNGRDRTRKRLEEIEENGLAISIISLAEVYEGIYYSKDPEGNEKALLDFLQDVTVISIDEEISRLFGKERGRLRAVGKMASDFDLLIGITARRYGLTLLTNNCRHFENMGRKPLNQECLFQQPGEVVFLSPSQGQVFTSSQY